MKYLRQQRVKQEKKRRARLWREAARRIQLREFRNIAFISIDDIPLIPYNGDIEQLNKVRENVYHYWL